MLMFAGYVAWLEGRIPESYDPDAGRFPLGRSAVYFVFLGSGWVTPFWPVLARAEQDNVARARIDQVFWCCWVASLGYVAWDPLNLIAWFLD